MKYNLYFLLLLIVQTGITSKISAQSKKPASGTGSEVIITEHPLSKDAIFKADSLVSYDLDLQNTYASRQSGTLSYLITTPHGKLVAQSTMAVALSANSKQTVHLDMPSQKAGFYKVNFMLNVNDYDDTVRRVFGVDIYKLKSATPKPADFDLFWKNTKAELAKVAPNFKLTEKPDRAQPGYTVYLIEMQSLGNITIRGWLTLPKERLPNEVFPVYMALPGYAASLDPIPGVAHFASIALNVRGQGNSRDVVNPTRDEYITYNLHDKNKYILRGAIMDCERMMDYIASNKMLDIKSVYVTGGSMGGYLALALAGLDSRVSLAAADNPTFSDFRWTVGIQEFPMTNYQYFAKKKGNSMVDVLNTLDYFDLKNFTPTIQAKTITGIGLLDNYAPPFIEMVAYNGIPANKRLYIYPNLGHEIGASLGNIKGKWLYDNFHMYDRIMNLSGKAAGGGGGGALQPIADNDDANAEKYETNPVGIMVHPGNEGSVFPKNSTIYYTFDLKNNSSVIKTGTLTCTVSSQTGEHTSTTSGFIRIAPNAVQNLRLNLPLEKAGYYKAEIILDVKSFKDTLHRTFGVDVDGLKNNTDGSVGITAIPNAKNAAFNGKETVFYNVELKSNFNSTQQAMLACEVRNNADKFVSLTSVAVELSPTAVNKVRINLPAQKKGTYKANFIVTAGSYSDTLRQTFSVDTAGTGNITGEDETVNITEHPGSKDALFKGNTLIYYDVDLKNNYSKQESGRLSCQVVSMDGKVLSNTSLPLSLFPNANKLVHLVVPARTTGFYKVNFIVNVSDYDDTLRRVFGVNIYNVHSPHPKPGNFDQFWNDAKQELGRVDPKFKLIEKPEFSRGNDQVYLIEMQSIGNLTVRGWLTLPKDRKPNQKFPVYLALPGYGADQKPFHDMPDFAAIALNVRGQGNSNDVLGVAREEFLTYNINDKDKYIMRGAIMDCVRMVDFIFSRPEFDPKAIYANGGSMGGYLSLILASLDKRVAICSAGNPAFADFRALVDNNDFPMGAIQRYVKENDLDLGKVLNNLDYFDLKNFVDEIKCKTLIGIGLLDNLAPPNTEMAVYNNIPGEKKIFIFPNLGHEVGDDFGAYSGRWAYDSLGVF